MEQELWLTRDRWDGVLVDSVEAWAVVPDRRVMDDGDVLWLAPLHLVDRRKTLVGSVALEMAREYFGDAVPQSDLECCLAQAGA